LTEILHSAICTGRRLIVITRLPYRVI
jgi:hypothetical protein